MDSSLVSRPDKSTEAYGCGSVCASISDEGRGVVGTGGLVETVASVPIGRNPEINDRDRCVLKLLHLIVTAYANRKLG